MTKFRTWGERLFYDDVKFVHGKKQRKGDSLSKGKIPATKHSASYYKERIKAMIENHPQVMVKVTGGDTSIKQLKNHIDYISRNGEVDLETEEGEIIQEKLKSSELNDYWGGDLFADGETPYKQSYHIVLSMPVDTDRVAFGRAARETAQNLFGEHQYYLAEHKDTEHPHVHVCIKALDKDGVRLPTKKADLQYWREVFAANLRANGIKAEATKRAVRGQFAKNPSTAVYRMRQRGAPMAADERFNEDMANNGHQDSVATHKARKTRYAVRGIYEEMISELSASSDAQDKALAKQLQQYLKDMPKIEPNAKNRYNQDKAELTQANDLKEKLQQEKRITLPEHKNKKQTQK